MQIKERQIETFRSSLLKHFEDRALEHARRCYPAHTAQYADEALRHSLRKSIQRAAAYNLVSEQQVIRFFDTALLLGSDFDSTPRHRWAHRVLTNASYSADYRAGYLLSKACKLNNASAAEERADGGY